VSDHTPEQPGEAREEGLDPGRIPRHVAIIMDGNGRWAQARGLPRVVGHRAGSDSVRAVIEGCNELGVAYLTLYTFSAENWRRPRLEVEALMALIEENMRREVEELHQKGVRVQAIGRLHELPQSLQDELARTQAFTRENKKLVLTLAINYGGRAEIVDAAARLAEQAARGALRPEDLDEEAFARSLYTAEMPDPDLLIRTAGEMRVSNYLLWQIAYAEIWVTPVFWPEFRREHLVEAIREYQRRTRKFGGVAPTTP
jgi:undecaprenyl diphosphate synthase